MKIYLDNEFKCHTSNDGTMREVETEFFDGKCTELIEGYRFIPSGEKWVKPNGVIIRGECVFPWRNYEILSGAQNGYNQSNAENHDMIGDAVSAYETAPTASHNYEVGELITLNNVAYEVIKNIPRDGKIIEWQNVVKTTITEYLEEKEYE